MRCYRGKPALAHRGGGASKDTVFRAGANDPEWRREKEKAGDDHRREERDQRRGDPGAPRSRRGDRSDRPGPGGDAGGSPGAAAATAGAPAPGSWRSTRSWRTRARCCWPRWRRSASISSWPSSFRSGSMTCGPCSSSRRRSSMPSTRRTPPLPCRSGSASSVDALWGSLLARLEGPANRRFQRYASDPVAFVETVLGQRPWAKQAEILRAVAAAPQTTVRSSHGVGKTWVAACCALWWVYSHHPSLVLTTAPTARQVEGLLWAEINRLWHGANERRD